MTFEPIDVKGKIILRKGENFYDVKSIMKSGDFYQVSGADINSKEEISMKIKAVGFLQALDHFYKMTKETGKEQFLLLNLDTGEWTTYNIDDLRRITKRRHIVYCPKCGTKNPDEAKVCTQCEAALPGKKPTRRHERRREEECFEPPRDGAVAGIIFGIIIILAGLFWLLGFEFWRILWPLIVIAFGILVLAGSFRRKR